MQIILVHVCSLRRTPDHGFPNSFFHANPSTSLLLSVAAMYTAQNAPRGSRCDAVEFLLLYDPSPCGTDRITAEDEFLVDDFDFELCLLLHAFCELSRSVSHCCIMIIRRVSRSLLLQYEHIAAIFLNTSSAQTAPKISKYQSARKCALLLSVPIVAIDLKEAAGMLVHAYALVFRDLCSIYCCRSVEKCGCCCASEVWWASFFSF